jgi:hypothetical protein
MCNIVSSLDVSNGLGNLRYCSHGAAKAAVSTSPHDSAVSGTDGSPQKREKCGTRRRKWLPPDDKAFLFTVVVLTYLVAALVHFFQTGDGSMLTTLLEWVGAYVGVKTIANQVSPFISHERKRRDSAQSLEREEN